MHLPLSVSSPAVVYVSSIQFGLVVCEDTDNGKRFFDLHQNLLNFTKKPLMNQPTYTVKFDEDND